MSYEYVIDSYAWVEYFRGSSEGKTAQKYIEHENCATSSVTIAELSEKYKRENKTAFWSVEAGQGNKKAGMP